MRLLMTEHSASACLAAVLIVLAALGGCATEVPTTAIARLTPEQLAAIPLPGPTQAEEATRLTRQADREAQEARLAQERRELELQRWREFERRYHWSLDYWRGYPSYYGWGAGYRLP